MLTDREVIDLLKDKVDAAGSIRQWAKEHGVSKSTVSRCLLSGDPWPSVARGLGLYRRFRIWGTPDEVMGENDKAAQ
jgi:hypothetical protein